MVDLPILLANFHTEAENVVGRVHEELKLRMGNMLKIFSNLSLNIRIFIMLVRKKPYNIITGLPFSFFFFFFEMNAIFCFFTLKNTYEETTKMF